MTDFNTSSRITDKSLEQVVGGGLSFSSFDPFKPSTSPFVIGAAVWAPFALPWGVIGQTGSSVIHTVGSVISHLKFW